MHFSCSDNFADILYLDAITVKRFGQLYLLEKDMEEVFLKVLKLPICRFSRKLESPLSIEMLQSKVYQWFLTGSIPATDDQWMPRMLSEMRIEEDEGKVLLAVEDVCGRVAKSLWCVCPSCQRQFI
jgi:hypothetical protein